MKKIIRIDELGNFIEDILIREDEEIPINCIDVICPDGFYLPKWNGETWVEGMSQAEIDALNNVPHELTLEDRVATTETKVVTIEETIDVLFGGTV